MQEAEIIRRFLFPADQQSSRAIEPGVRAFDFPAASLAATVLRFRRFVFFAWDVRRISALTNFGIDGLAGVAFIEAEMLRVLSSRLGPFDGNCVERFGDQLLVRYVGAGDGDTQRYAATVDERRSLDTQLAAIRRVFAGFFPRPAATWSSPRPCSASSNRFLSTRHTRRERVARAPRTRPVPPTLGNRRGSRCPNRIAWASPSIDNRWPTHKGCRRPRSASTIADGPLCNSHGKSAAPSRFAATRLPEYRETSTTTCKAPAPPAD